MIRKEMIKKHLLTRSVMLVLVLISMLNIYGTTNTETGTKPLPLSLRTSKFIFISSKRAVAYNFASEALPVNDAKVNYKLFKTLRKHDFRNVQSNILHRKASWALSKGGGRSNILTKDQMLGQPIPKVEEDGQECRVSLPLVGKPPDAITDPP